MRKRVSIIFSWLLGPVFIYAAITKIIAPASFYHDVRNYHLLPDFGAWYWANFLPWLEVFSGAGLLLASTRRAASFLIAALMMVFIAAISSAWWRGLHVDCGCFGETARTTNYAWLLVRDGLLFLAAIYVSGGSLILSPEGANSGHAS